MGSLVSVPSVIGIGLKVAGVPSLLVLSELQAPDTLVNDATLNQMKELRPTTDDELMLVGGFGAKALMHFAVPLLQVVNGFCSSSKHLKPTTDWHFVRRSKDAVRQRGLQQASGHFAQWNQQQQGQGAEQAPGDNMFTQFGMGSAQNAQGTGVSGSARSARGRSQQQAAGGPTGSVFDEGPMMVTDPHVYQVRAEDVRGTASAMPPVEYCVDNCSLPAQYEVVGASRTCYPPPQWQDHSSCLICSCLHSWWESGCIPPTRPPAPQTLSEAAPVDLLQPG